MSIPSSSRYGLFRPSSPSVSPWGPVSPNTLIINGKAISDRSIIVPNSDLQHVQIQFACPQAVKLAELVINSRPGSPYPSFSSSSTSDSLSPFASSPDSVSLEVRSPTPLALIELGELLGRNSPIGALDLKDNQLEDADIVPVFNGLKSNLNVTSLDLQRNALTDRVMEPLLEILNPPERLPSTEFLPTGLQMLDLSLNQITDEGVDTLSAALRSNTSLQTLRLTSNGITNHGVSILAQRLKENSTLTNLDLRYNPIGEEGIQALRSLLDYSPTLTSVRFAPTEEARPVNLCFFLDQLSFDEESPVLAEASERNQHNQMIRIPSLYERLIKNLMIGAYNPFPHRKLNSKTIGHLATFIEMHPYLSSLNLQEVEKLSQRGREGVVGLLKANPHIVSLSPYLDVRTGIRQALRRNRARGV